MSNYNIAVIINRIAGRREGGIFSRFSTVMICSNDNYNNNNVNFIYIFLKSFQINILNYWRAEKVLRVRSPAALRK